MKHVNSIFCVAFFLQTVGFYSKLNPYRKVFNFWENIAYTRKFWNKYKTTAPFFDKYSFLEGRKIWLNKIN